MAFACGAMEAVACSERRLEASWHSEALGGQLGRSLHAGVATADFPLVAVGVLEKHGVVARRVLACTTLATAFAD
jgi:hypothetical protein